MATPSDTVLQFYRRFKPACFLLLISLIISVTAFWLMLNLTRNQQFKRFNQQATTATGNVETYLSFVLQAMKGMKGVFSIREIPNPVELDSFMDAILISEIAKTGGMRDIGLIWKVAAESTNQHMQFMKQNGNPDYLLRYHKKQNTYFPIVYIHSVQTNSQEVLGWDAYYNKSRIEAMMQAAETGDPIVTEKLSLFDPDGTSPGGGIVIYLPIYRHALDFTTPAQRITNLLGFAFCSIKQGSITAKTIQETPGLKMRVYDGENVAQDKLLFESSSLNQQAKTSPLFTGKIHIDVLGRPWTFHMETGPEFASSLEIYLPWSVLGLGIIFSFCLFAYYCSEIKARLKSEDFTLRYQKLNENLEYTIARGKETEQLLARSLSLQLATIEATADGILVMNMDGHIITANKRFQQMWQLSDHIFNSKDREAIIEAALGQLIDPDHCYRHLENLMKFPEEESFDLLRLKDGRIFERYSMPQKQGKDVVGRVFSYRDVTETIRVQDALRKSEHKYRRLVELSHDLIGTVDLEGRMTFVNKAIKQIYGYEPEELVGQSFVKLIAPDQVEKDVQIFQTILEKGSVSSYVTKHRRKDGSDVWLCYNSTVIRDEHGVVNGIMGTASDITERIRFEESLKDSEALYHSLVEYLPQFIFRKNLHGQFIYANQNFCNLLQKDRQEVIGKTDFEFWPTDLAAKYQRDDQWVLAHQEMLETTECHEKVDGRVTYVQVVKTPIYDGKGALTGIQGIFWDITERKIAEERLAHEKEQLAVTLGCIADGVVALSITHI
ncbi:MAG: PAS domain S-box protein [Verrucomicrobiales bacterium]